MIFEDDHKGELWFEESYDDGGVDVLAREEDGALVRFRVPPLLFPDVIREMHEVAGTGVPVMLARPDIDIAKPTFTGDFQVWKEADGRVGFMPADAEKASATGALRLEPHRVRQLAAVAVAYADAEAPDDGEFELAAILAAHPGATFPEMARAVLADGRFGRLDGAR